MTTELEDDGSKIERTQYPYQPFEPGQSAYGRSSSSCNNSSDSQRHSTRFITYTIYIPIPITTLRLSAHRYTFVHDSPRTVTEMDTDNHVVLKLSIEYFCLNQDGDNVVTVPKSSFLNSLPSPANGKKPFMSYVPTVYPTYEKSSHGIQDFSHLNE